MEKIKGKSIRHTKNNMVKVTPYLSIITSNVKESNTPIKSRDLWNGFKIASNYMSGTKDPL